MVKKTILAATMVASMTWSVSAQDFRAAMAALSDVSVTETRLDLNASPFPAVFVEVSNGSAHSFSFLGVECRVLKDGRSVAVAEGVMMGVQPGARAATDAYITTLNRDVFDATAAECRISMGM